MSGLALSNDLIVPPYLSAYPFISPTPLLDPGGASPGREFRDTPNLSSPATVTGGGLSLGPMETQQPCACLQGLGGEGCGWVGGGHTAPGFPDAPPSPRLYRASSQQGLEAQGLFNVEVVVSVQPLEVVCLPCPGTLLFPQLGLLVPAAPCGGLAAAGPARVCMEVLPASPRRAGALEGQGRPLCLLWSSSPAPHEQALPAHDHCQCS